MFGFGEPLATNENGIASLSTTMAVYGLENALKPNIFVNDYFKGKVLHVDDGILILRHA